jgi:hypothetical protein
MVLVLGVNQFEFITGVFLEFGWSLGFK